MSLRQEGIGIPPRRVGSTLYSAVSDKAHILISEFQSVFTREDTSFIPWLGPSKTRIGKVTAQEAGVRKLLSQLKPHKASGPNKIPNRVLREHSAELAPSLTALFNQSLESGTIPDDWSKASISPVFKKGSVHDAANYRPVSLTCVACKLLEHIVVKHMLHYLEEHKLLSSLQHGFRKGHSCETQLLITLDDFFMSYDRKIQTDVGILDFNCAFDTVPLGRLLGKLASYGISGPLNSWIRAFLTGRTMSVTIDGVTSDPADVLSGVPQRMVLGPLLFLIYINDMPGVVSHGTYVRLFADDCLAYRPIHSDQDQIILQHDITALQNWAERWGMRFNPKKCYIMHIHRSQIWSRIYQLCGEVFYSVSKAKYLGVVISNDFSWNEQVCKVAAKANTILHFISRNLKHCPRSMRQTAYCSHLLKITDIFDVQCMKFWYKFSNNTLPNYFRSMFQYNSSLYETETRNHDRMHVFPTRTFGARNVLRHRLPELVYQFPADLIRKAKTHSITAFSNHIKHHILESYSYDCIELNCYVCNNIAS